MIPTWSYGITSVTQRIDTLLPKTICSLSSGGFSIPRLFIDGLRDPEILTEIIGGGKQLSSYEYTLRFPKVNAFSNWILSLWELYARDPNADRYAIFQDDSICNKRLREYLDTCNMPYKGYWNLLTWPHNEKDTVGWHPTDQQGRGAVGLVFSNEGIRTLLSQRLLVDQPKTVKGWKCIDGIAVDCMSRLGWKEYAHSPSLLYHAGEGSSTIGTKEKTGLKAQPRSFMGEVFDATVLCHKQGRRLAEVL